MRFTVIHGPKLDQLGTREPEIYGTLTLGEIDSLIIQHAAPHEIETFQSDSEDALIEKIHEAREKSDGIILNAGAFTHTSHAIRDAISSSVPTVEVHISNVHAREEFRWRSVIAPATIGHISGFGWYSYVLGLQALLDHLSER